MRFEVRTILPTGDPVIGSAADICASLNRLAQLRRYDNDEERLQAALDEIVDPDNQVLLGLSLVAVDTKSTTL